MQLTVLLPGKCNLAAAAELGMPLIHFDVGSLMSKWVGETESNCRTALQQIDAMSPCLVQMDEIEKGFGSVGRDGDSGARMRAFGTVVKWMSERTCPAYVIMTANNEQMLPPEFTRKGRVDEIFGVYLFEGSERRVILAIRLRKRNRDPERYDSGAIANASCRRDKAAARRRNPGDCRPAGRSRASGR